MSYSGADPDALAVYTAQTLDAADALRPIDARLDTVEALLRRALPKPPAVRSQVQGYARLARKTRELGERVGRFGLKLRDALGGPSSKTPMSMDGLLFPLRTDSPPKPVGWDGWDRKERAAYLKQTDPQIVGATIVNPYDIGRVFAAAGKGLVNGVLGAVDGIANTATFGLAPDLDPAFADEDTAASFTVGRWTGTIATGVAAPEVLAKLAPAVGAQTATGFLARRGVDVAVGAASDASLDRHHTPGSMAAAGLTGGVAGGALDGAAQAYTAWRVSTIEPTVISHGFDSVEEWQAFSAKLHDGLAAAGYPDAQAAVQGSGATGRSYKTGMPFDVGRVSDLDVAVTGRGLLCDAEATGIEMRSGGMRTAPVPYRVQKALGVADLLKGLTADTGPPREDHGLREPSRGRRAQALHPSPQGVTPWPTSSPHWSVDPTCSPAPSIAGPSRSTTGSPSSRWSPTGSPRSTSARPISTRCSPSSGRSPTTPASTDPSPTCTSRRSVARSTRRSWCGPRGSWPWPPRWRMPTTRSRPTTRSACSAWSRPTASTSSPPWAWAVTARPRSGSPIARANRAKVRSGSRRR